MTHTQAHHTQRITVDPNNPDPAVLARAGEIIRRGGLVAFPTETVYGLGAHALDAAAVTRIFVAKERPAHDPIIVHVADVDALPALTVDVPEIAYVLAARFWPGALTLVLPRSARVPDVVTAGGPTVAIRSPDHPLALALIRAAGVPIGAPSANRFSHTSPTTAQHVWDDLAGRIDMILDGGPTPIGVESTVLDVTGARPRVLRPGGVAVEALRRVIGPVEVGPGPTAAAATAGTIEALPAPGMLERHYAPQATLHLYPGEAHTQLPEMQQQARRETVAGRRVGVMAADEFANAFAPPVVVAALGPLASASAVAQRLYAAMRDLDAAHVDVIIAHEIPADGLGLAVNDRLRRAAQAVHAPAQKLPSPEEKTGG